MTRLWLVRAEGGTLTERFIEGDYVAIVWDELGDLSELRYYDTLVNMVNDVHLSTGQRTVNNWASQVARFVWGIDSEDFVLTPSADYRVLRFGRIPPPSSSCALSWPGSQGQLSAILLDSTMDSHRSPEIAATGR